MVPTACIHTVLAHSSIHDYTHTHTHTQRPTQLASPGSDLRLPRVQLRFRRVVRTVCTASACHVLECRNLPGPFKALGHTVCARWLTASVGEPGVPNRVKLGTVKVMLLVVNPARTAGLLFIVFPIRVPVAVVRQKKKHTHVEHTCQCQPCDPIWHHQCTAYRASIWQSRRS